jgi:hypothetical protein
MKKQRRSKNKDPKKVIPLSPEAGCETGRPTNDPEPESKSGMPTPPKTIRVCKVFYCAHV